MKPNISRDGRRFGCGIVVRSVAALAVAASSASSVAHGAPGVEPARHSAPTTSPKRSVPSRPATMVDPAVTPAGGHGCRDCGPGGCGRGQACGHRHHRDCRDGVCAPYCPVRPGTFGFYGTNWRKWPGQGVVPVSHDAAATPALPPRSEVPGADDESFKTKADELPEPRADGAERETPRSSTPPEPPAPEPEQPAPEPDPAAEKPKARDQEPGRLPPGDDKQPTAEDNSPPSPPDAKPAPKPRPQDENLFDENAARVRRRIPVAKAGPAAPSRDAGGVVKAALDRPAPAATSGRVPARRPTPKPVPRVSFDPRAEGLAPAR